MLSRLDKWHGKRLFSLDADNNKASRVGCAAHGRQRVFEKEGNAYAQYLQVTGRVVNGLILADGWANE